jgi:Tol biopolymer transport system component
VQSDDRQYNAVWSPDGKWIVYQQDRADDELWDLYAVPSEGGEVVNLTNTPAIREQDPHWSHDGPHDRIRLQAEGGLAVRHCPAMQTG